MRMKSFRPYFVLLCWEMALISAGLVVSTEFVPLSHNSWHIRVGGVCSAGWIDRDKHLTLKEILGVVVVVACCQRLSSSLLCLYKQRTSEIQHRTEGVYQHRTVWVRHEINDVIVFVVVHTNLWCDFIDSVEVKSVSSAIFFQALIHLLLTNT